MRAVPNSFQQLAGAFEGRSHAEVTAGQLLNIRLDGVDGEDFAERKAVNCHGWLVELEKPQSVQSSVDICVPQVRDEDTLVPVIIQRATRFKSVLERRIHSVVDVSELVVKNVAKILARPLPTREAENDLVGGIQDDAARSSRRSTPRSVVRIRRRGADSRFLANEQAVSPAILVIS